MESIPQGWRLRPVFHDLFWVFLLFSTHMGKCCSRAEAETGLVRFDFSFHFFLLFSAYTFMGKCCSRAEGETGAHLSRVQVLVNQAVKCKD